jgi:hypothetical protein
MSEKLPNKILQITNEDSKLENQQELQRMEDEIVRNIWKKFGEKGLLVFLPLVIGIAGATYGTLNKTEIDKLHTQACSYNEDPAIMLANIKNNGNPDWPPTCLRTKIYSKQNFKFFV